MTIPTPPTNFNLDFHANEGVQLNPLEVYLTAIFAMYQLATHFQWNELWPRAITTFALVNRGVWIKVVKERREMRTFHVIFALYFTVITLVSRSPFLQYHTDMYQSTRLIGGLAIEEVPETTSLNISMGAIDYISTSNATTPDSTSYTSGLGTSIALPDMNITYRYVGVRINSRDLYTAVLSGLADASKAGMDHICAELPAYSHSGDLVFWIYGEDFAMHPFTFKAVTHLLRAIVLDMTLEQRRFAEINFEVTNGTEGIAYGFVRKLPFQGNGTTSVEAARRLV